MSILDRNVLSYLRESAKQIAIQEHNNLELKTYYENLGELAYNPCFNEEMIPVIKDEDGYYVEFSDLMRVAECYEELENVNSPELAIKKICEHYNIQEAELIVIMPSQKQFESYLESLVYVNESDDDDDYDDAESDDESDDDYDDDELEEGKCKKEGKCGTSKKKKSKASKSIGTVIDKIKSTGVNIVKRKK